jgi:hypothetical protein
MASNFVPKVTEQNDEYIFELRDEVFMSVAFASEKKLRFQMWRQTTLLAPDEGNIFAQSFRDKLVEQARAGFNEAGKPDAVPHIAEDVAIVATLLGSKAGDGKSLHDRLKEGEGPSITERLIKLGEENAALFHTPDKGCVVVGNFSWLYAIYQTYRPHRPQGLKHGRRRLPMRTWLGTVCGDG